MSPKYSIGDWVIHQGSTRTTFLHIQNIINDCYIYVIYDEDMNIYIEKHKCLIEVVDEGTIKMTEEFKAGLL